MLRQSNRDERKESEGIAGQRCVQQEVSSELEVRREDEIVLPRHWCVQPLTNGRQSW